MLTFFKFLFLFVCLFLVIGILFEQYSRWQLEKTVFDGKTFVEIDNKKIHYLKKGTGNCTIVFQSGMGSSYFIWNEVQDSLSHDAVTISYDRSSLMLSDRSSEKVTNEQVTKELIQLLEKTNCPKPYIVVGHSMAGIYLRPFIDQQKEAIKGIVFVDAAHPQQIKKSSEKLLKAITPPPHWFIKFAVHTGIYRTLFSFIPIHAEIPVDHPMHKMEKDFFYRSCSRILEEVNNDRANFKDAEQYCSFGNIPLRVIMGTNEIRYKFIKDQALREEYKSIVYEVQTDLLNLSSNSKLIEAKNSGHLIQINDSQLIIDQIRDVLVQ